MVSNCQNLLPLATSGDGNCLLHAASLGELRLQQVRLHMNSNVWARLGKLFVHVKKKKKT